MDEYAKLDHLDETDDSECDIISLIDEDGEEHAFEVIDTTEMDGKEYMALLPIYDDPDEAVADSGELVILWVSDELDEDGEPYLEPVIDEDEFDKVAAVFMEHLGDLYDFTTAEEEE